MYQTALVRTEFGNGYPAKEPFARALDEAARSGQPMLTTTYHPPVACRQAQGANALLHNRESDQRPKTLKNQCFAPISCRSDHHHSAHPGFIPEVGFCFRRER